METKEEEAKAPPKKGILTQMKETVDEREEQLALLSTFVRLGILVWSGAILTLAYVDLPEAFKMPKQDLDPTFIASVFTGVLATFGVQTSKGKNGCSGGGITQAELKELVDAASQTAPTQTIRIEHAPIKFTTDSPESNQ